MRLTVKQIHEFQNVIWDFYKQHGRPFVWRHVEDPYKIVVSEIMLQQTQTERVIPKYEQFITTFKSFSDLANASLHDVLFAWQGLGYNRRGKYLHQIAQKVVNDFKGNLPQDTQILESFPGIGVSTAGSICAFAFNVPTVFIETNIRAVFLHTFFKDKEKILDTLLMPLIEQTVDKRNSREWYYALMDYGVFLKKQHKNPSRRSAHYIKQSTFKGSDRQIRGAIIRELTRSATPLEKDIILARVCADDIKKAEGIMQQLIKEGLVVCDNKTLKIP